MPQYTWRGAHVRIQPPTPPPPPAASHLSNQLSNTGLKGAFHPPFPRRFSIFTREQEQKQKAVTSGSGESASDLVAYVAFQRNYKWVAWPLFCTS